MFGIFKKHKNLPVHHHVPDRVVFTIVHKILRFQERWAGYMQRITGKVSLKTQKWLVILFCLVAGGCSLFVTLTAFSGKQKIMLHVAPIKASTSLTENGEKNIRDAPSIPLREFKKIERFRLYMDSLHHTVDGRRIADSILIARPGLMDSIVQLEKLYQPFKK